MLQQQARIINTFVMALDAFCIILAGYSAYYLKWYMMNGRFLMPSEIFVTSILLVMVVNNYAMARLNLYGDKKPFSFFSLLWPVFNAIIVNFAVLSTAVFLLKQIHYSRSFLLMFAGFSYFYLILIRLIIYYYFRYKSKNGFNLHYILIVGTSDRAKIVADVFEKQLSWGHKVVGRLSPNPESCADEFGCLGSVDKLPDILRRLEIDEVVFAFGGEKTFDLSPYLLICRQMGIQIRILPALWSQDAASVSFEHCQNVPFITMKTDNFNASGLLYKRIIDLIGGLVGLLIFLLIYPIVAIAIKMDSEGPVIFKQKRVGQNGRIFNLFKFRSMYKDAEQRKQELREKNQMNGALFKLENDPRITKVGKWLRKFSIDEFPQFLNVLKGEMSMVGTRPPTIDEVQMYMPQHLRRISAKPGITGLWQISGRNEIREFEKVVELDCQYLDNWRFSDDLKILAKTCVVVLKRKGAI